MRLAVIENGKVVLSEPCVRVAVFIVNNYIGLDKSHGDAKRRSITRDFCGRPTALLRFLSRKA